MQLKTIGESLNVTNTINSVIKNSSDLSGTFNENAVLAHRLAEATSGYSIEAIKASIAQSTLNEEEIKAILSAKGLTGEILETTTAELAQITSTNALSASQKKATISTVDLGNAIKGLGAKVKAFFAAHPMAWAGLAVGGIIGIVSAIKSHNEKLEEAKQKIHDLGEEARNTADEINSNFESTKSTVNDVSKKYAELAQEVKNLGTISQSQGTLSTDEYNEFLDISNQLAGLFPELTTCYDENGNAILRLNGDVEKITDSLNTLISAEEQAASLKIADEMDDIFNDYSLTVNGEDGYAAQYNEILNKKKVLDDYYAQILNTGITDGFSGLSDEVLTELQTQLENAGIDLDTFYNKPIMGESFTQEEMDAIKAAFAIIGEEYEKELNGLSTKIDAENKQFGSYLINSFKSNGLYQKISDRFGTEGTNLVNSILTNSGYDTLLAEAGGDWDKAVEYLEDNILANFTDLSDEEIQEFQSVYAKLLAINPDKALAENIPLIEEYINRLAELLQIDAEQIEIAFGVDPKADEDLLNKARDKFGYKDNASSIEDVKRNAEIDAFINSLNEEDAQLLVDADIPDYVLKGIKDDWEKFLAELQEKTDEAEVTIDPTIPLADIKDAYSGLESIYDDIRNGTTVAADSIESLNEAFGELDGGTALQEFKDVLTTMPDDIDAQQEALNELATAYLDNSDLMQNLSEDNADYVKSELEKIGVINADEVVQSRLAAQSAEYRKAVKGETNAIEEKTFATYKAQLANQGYSSSVISEIDALYRESVSAGKTQNEIYKLITAKLKANQTALRTDGDIKNLGDLINSIGKGISALNALMAAKLSAGISASIGLAQYAAPKLAQVNYGGANSNSSGGSGGSGSGGGSSSSEQTPETFDWIETDIDRTEEAVDRLDKTVDNVYEKWSKRNASLSDEISKIKYEIGLQQAAYDAYMAKANSIGLADDYKQKVQNGAIQIEDIADENLRNQIEQYQEWYNKAVQCSDAIQDLKINLSELAEQKFDNIQTEFDGLISTITAYADIIDERINRTEEHGYFVSKDYYNQLISYEKDELSKLESKYAALVKARDEAVSSGSIERDSEAWNEMTQEILDTQKAIEESTTALVEFNNEIRDLNWEIFDYLQDRINQITQESDFLIELLGKNDLYDESGNFSDAGMATMALNAIKYNTYMQQSINYAKELKEVQAELSKDSENKDLIERREELLELQQEAISNAEAEKDAIKSLVEDGINLHLEALDDLISKYEESLDAAKDLYEYQKNIAEQTNEIAKLEKILMAYQGDDSESTRKLIQDAQNQLNDAKTELQETEWDRYISETKELLSNMRDNYEEVLNARLDNIDALISDMIDTANENANTIRDTILDATEDVGYNITSAMQTILGDGGKISNLVSSFENTFNNNFTTLQAAINDIKSYVYSMTDAGKQKVEEESSSSSVIPSILPSISRDPNTSSSFLDRKSDASSYARDGVANVGDAVTFASGKYHEDSWGNGKSGSQMLGGTVYITKIAPNSPYPYHIGRINKYGEENLGWVKLDQLKGYRVGSKRISEDQLAWTQENGSEIIYRARDGALLTPVNQGDMVFTNEMSQRLWEMSKGNMPALNVGANYKIPENLSNNIRTVNNENSINITLPNVKNYDEFKSGLQKDKSFIGFMQEATLGQALGKNSLNRNKY